MQLPTGRRCIVLGLFLFMTGCATGTPPPAPTPAPAPRYTYSQANGRAQVLLLKYQSMADSGRSWTNTLYLWLAAIGSTIIGLGVTGTSGVPITALGLGGAFSYGVSTWFVRPEHLSIYKAGSDALLCVIQESRPLSVADVLDEDLKKSIALDAPFPKALAGLAEALSRLKAVQTSTDTDATKKLDAVTTGQTALDTGTTLLKDARVMHSQLELAGQQEWDAISVVENEVTFALARSTDPRDVMAHIQQNVVGTYKSLIGLSGGATPSLKGAGDKLQAAPLTGNADLDAKIRAVSDAAAELARTSTPVSELLDAITIAGVKEGIAGCLSGARALSVQLVPDAIELGAGEKKTVRVIGTTTVTVEYLSGSDKAVSFKTAASVAGTTIEVMALTDAKAGDYTLLVIPPAPAPPLTLRVKVKGVKADGAADEKASSRRASAADVRDLLTQQTWTCQGGPPTVGPSADVSGATQAVLNCGNTAAAQQVVTAHQGDKAPPKGVVVTTDGKGKVQLTIPGDYDAALALLKGTPK